MQARADLARTSQLTIMGGLAASIAHEINQPLASIVSHADASYRWLKREKPDIDEALKGLDSIRKNGLRAGEIIKALRALAKQAPSTVEDVDLTGIINEVLRLTSPEIQKNKVQVVTRLTEERNVVRADPIQLQQVILNLVTNAMDALSGVPEVERSISIDVSRVDNSWVVCVEDKGKGMDAETVKRVFDPFYTTKSTGMGMGLAICRSIIEAHGGSLNVASTVGKGTVFSFGLAAVPS
jgi:C4-dicarboxylate-specific signal transduction histidine kinase